MAKSVNLELNLTPEIEIAQTLFDEWRQSIDGFQGENPSNFEIIDTAIGEINEKLNNLTILKFERVEQLPPKQDAKTDIIYLVPASESGESNVYDEYIFLETENNYELIGSTQIIFDQTPTENSQNAVTSGGVYTALQDKVDKEQGKGLSSNDYTNNEKSKLEGIETGAQVNVQADWEEENPNSDAYIANKPTVPAAQVNADWEADSGVAEILNKPDLSIYAESNDLADVAFSGSYNDLSDTPDIEDMIAEEQSRAIAVETELETKIEKKQDKLTAGANITIDSNNVISATGGSSESPIEAGKGIEITTESDNTKTISISNEVATKSDIPTNYVTTNTVQNISGFKVFTNTNGIQSRSSATSSNRVIIDGTSESWPSIEIQKGGADNDNLHIYPGSLEYLPDNGSSNTDFKIITHYPDSSSKKFTYTFKAPLYTDTAKTLTVATTDDITAISGTNDGTNWTSLTIGEDTYGLASGGGSGMDITAQEIEDYFNEYCDIEAEVTEETIEGKNVNVLDLDNVDIEIDKDSEGIYQALNLNADNVSAANKILDIE